MYYIKLFEDFNEEEFIEKYNQGRCEVFALALHLELGYTIILYIDSECEYEDEEGETFYAPGLVHTYAEDAVENMFDVNGKITKDNLDDHADYVTDGEYVYVTPLELTENYIKTKILAKITKKELDICCKYIRVNITKYKL